jgi:hypothetical protein
MVRAGVTVVCAVGVVAAVLALVRLWDTTRTPSPSTADMGFGERLAVTVGRSAGMLAGAFTAAILVLGLGGRLMMRVLAATSSTSAQGRITDAEEIVGEVTLGGTVGLVLFVGLASGAVALAGYALLRRWLPDRSLVAGLIAAAIGAGLLAQPTGLVDPDNPDFVILSPRWLAVLLCVGLIVLFGMVFGVLVDRLAPVWPRPSWSITGVAAVVPFAPLILAPPLAVVAVAAVLVAAYVAGPVNPTSGPLDLFGRRVVTVLAGLGGAATMVAAGQILTL